MARGDAAGNFVAREMYALDKNSQTTRAKRTGPGVFVLVQFCLSLSRSCPFRFGIVVDGRLMLLLLFFLLSPSSLLMFGRRVGCRCASATGIIKIITIIIIISTTLSSLSCLATLVSDCN